MTSRKRLALIIAAVVVALLAAAYFAMQSMTPPADLDLARSKQSAKGLYTIAIEPEAASFTQNEMHSWVLSVKTSAGAPVNGAVIGIDGGMPQHGHGLPTSPQATEIGDGRYRIDGVRFNMSGWWELKFAISATQGEDDVVFNVTL